MPGTPAYNANLTVYAPVSVAYAFYAFDSDTMDLYGQRDGRVDGGPATYVPGYVGNGQALLFNQSVPTQMSIANPFNLRNTSVTVEAFILIPDSSLNASILRFSSGVSINVRAGHLEIVLDRFTGVSSPSNLTSNEWHHIGMVYDASQQIVQLFIDGNFEGQLKSTASGNINRNNVTLTIGSGFEGMIDQLSIALEAKGADRINWDASVAAYYPLDEENSGWILDYGPNALNGSTVGTRPTQGHVRGALNFTMADAFYRTPGFMSLTIVNRSFTLAFWIQPGPTAGIVLTVSNSVSCLLVLGIRSSDNRLTVYLPNATRTNNDTFIVGSTAMQRNQWTHVALTWSSENQTQLYTATLLDGRSKDAVRLNNGQGGPMIVSLGNDRGSTQCGVGNGLNMTQSFLGALDEVYIFSRELKAAEIVQLSSVTHA